MTPQTIKKTADFQRVGKNGKKISTQSFALLYMPNELGCVRVGYTVSKKVSKRAVDRNKIKRRFRSLAKQFLPTEKPVDFVLIARSAALDMEFSQIKADFEFAAKKL